MTCNLQAVRISDEVDFVVMTWFLSFVPHTNQKQVH